MKIFNSVQRKRIDHFTIENEPIESINLMERAAFQCTIWLTKHIDRRKTLMVFAGCGNNGGDGLAIARQLKARDFKVEVYLIKVSEKLSTDASVNSEKIKQNELLKLVEVNSINQLPQINQDDVVIDAILGSGLRVPLTGIAAETIEYLNRCPGEKISIDIPSGLQSEGVAGNLPVLKADHTLTFQFPFLSFLFAENAPYIGHWHILDIGLNNQAISHSVTDYNFTGAEEIKLIKRPEFGHKGTFGHALIIAGSYGMAGAAFLSSKSCLVAGCGLVTVHVPEKLVSIIQTSFPEAIVSIDNSEKYISHIPDCSKYTAIGVGPGIGKNEETQKALISLLEKCNKPLVIDADALNILAITNGTNKIPANSIITPHPGEFDRLFGKCNNSFERLKLQQQKAVELGIYIILKGRFTCIAFPDGSCHFNPTGNPGMATAGSGDVLTGIIVSLLAQGYPQGLASIIGVYLHGLAGDMAIKNLACETLIASDIIQYFSAAINNIKFSNNETPSR
jgi:NAD(P)H-hydrate epimerase